MVGGRGMSRVQINEALAMLAQLKTMNRLSIPKPVALVIPRRLPYVRTPEEQSRMDEIRRECERLQALRSGLTDHSSDVPGLVKSA